MSDAGKLKCDLVMRGGITSGIIYPRAIAELAKVYQFQKIGGTSAGAIAAAVTAAAEYGRRQGAKLTYEGKQIDPYERLDRIPAELGKDPAKGNFWSGGQSGTRTTLFRLFQPQRSTEQLYRLITDRLLNNPGGKPGDRGALRGLNNGLEAINSMLSAFRGWGWLGALPGLFLCYLLIAWATQTCFGEGGHCFHKPSLSWYPEISDRIYDFTGVRGLLNSVFWIGGSLLAAALIVWVYRIFIHRLRGYWFVVAFCLWTIVWTAILVFFLRYVVGFGEAGVRACVQAGQQADLQACRQVGGQAGVQAGIARLLVIGPAIFIAAMGSLTISLLAATAAAYYKFSKALPANFYGMCSGVGRPDADGVAPLTNWLHGLIQAVSGLSAQRPLTVGDLWYGKEYHPESGTTPNNPEHEIELVLVTSNITLGMSHAFPYLESWRCGLYFSEADFRRLFPKEVVDWMVEKGKKTQAEPNVTLPAGIYPLPDAQHLPVVLGARISLSFPYLLSAVPMFAVDWSLEGNPLRPCWFSDGGLTSNFPIHLFDSPATSWPTFAINLLPATARIRETSMPECLMPEGLRSAVQAGMGSQPTRSAIPPSASRRDPNLWMPTNNNPDTSQVMRFNDFDASQASGRFASGRYVRGRGNPIGFFGALFDTARNWSDTEQMFLPGYRDRIVHVSLQDDEGGLNLNMPADLIRRLGERGAQAGRMLVARFGPPTKGITEINPKTGRKIDLATGEDIELDWDNHRWTRYRSLMASLEQMLQVFAKRWREEDKAGVRVDGGFTSLPELLRRRKEQDPATGKYLTPNGDFAWNSADQWTWADRITRLVVDTAEQINPPYSCFDPGDGKAGSPPQPKSWMRPVPSDDRAVIAAASKASANSRGMS